MAQTNTLQQTPTWRRYRPHSVFNRPNRPPVRSYDSHDIFIDAASLVERRLPHRKLKPQQIDSLMQQFRNRALVTNLPQDWLAALYVQAPRAAVAQQQMDQHPYGYHDKKARVFELIDFNDTFVAAILSMNQSMRARFVAQAKLGCDRICQQVRSPLFTDEQWIAIVRGLTREVAVYQAALDRGFDATMPNRSGDAMGVDLQVRDPGTGRYVNLDVKTPSSFRHRLEDLLQEGRMTEAELLEADARCYAVQHNGHKSGRVEVVLLCILPDKFGEFGDFRLLNSEPMRQMLNFLIREHGLSDGRYGMYR